MLKRLYVKTAVSVDCVDERLLRCAKQLCGVLIKSCFSQPQSGNLNFFFELLSFRTLLIFLPHKRVPTAQQLLLGTVPIPTLKKTWLFCPTVLKHFLRFFYRLLPTFSSQTAPYGSLSPRHSLDGEFRNQANTVCPISRTRDTSTSIAS